jgi:2-C-methyl-D-erythritol 4-phosphate cytidylyltransferase
VSTTQVWGIVLAAGSGTRLGEPKQFVRVGGRRLVDRAVDLARSVCQGVVLVLPADRSWDGAPVDAVAAGGAERLDSVAAGLRALPPTAEVVLVHDAAHPLASTRLATAVVDAVRAGAAAAIPGVRPPNAVKRVAGGRVVATVGRDDLVLAQMPQAFRAAVLRAAHGQPRPPAAVEDSVLVESLGETVVVVDGDPANLHVTDPASLRVAEALAAEADRAGHGAPR